MNRKRSYSSSEIYFNAEFRVRKVKQEVFQKIFEKRERFGKKSVQEK